MRLPRTAPALVVAGLALGLALGACGSTDHQTSRGTGGTTTTSAAPTTSGGAGEPGSPGTGATTTTPDSSSGSGSTPGGSGIGVSTTVGGTDPGATVPVPVAKEVPNRHDLVASSIVAPESVVADAHDPSLIHVRFWGGVPSCRPSEVTIVESDKAVYVTLRTGRAPGPMLACPDLAEYEQISVRLQAPLGGRALTSPTRD